MNKKIYLIIMRIVNAVMFFVAVIFMLLDTINPNIVFMYLYVAFFCVAAVLLIASSIIDLIRMESFVKRLQDEEDEEDEEDKLMNANSFSCYTDYVRANRLSRVLKNTLLLPICRQMGRRNSSLGHYGNTSIYPLPEEEANKEDKE